MAFWKPITFRLWLLEAIDRRIFHHHLRTLCRITVWMQGFTWKEAGKLLED